MDQRILNEVHSLTDLEIAVLVCFAAGQHCLFSTESSSALDLQQELEMICSQNFGIEPAIVQCDPGTTVDDFNEAVLDEPRYFRTNSPERLKGRGSTATSVTFARPQNPRSESDDNVLDDRKIAEVVIATNLDLASQSVQVQMIELLRTKRIFTRKAMHTAPKDLLLIAILSQPGARLSHHLNDMMAMSHYHAPSDGFPHLDHQGLFPTLSRDDIDHVRRQASHIRLTAELDAYLHNLVLFMRMDRFVQGGVTATATRHLRALAKALAPLHGLDFVTPSLVILAARKVYPHRLILATPETEKSLQWGSDPLAVRRILEGVSIEDVIENVIASVETPL